MMTLLFAPSDVPSPKWQIALFGAVTGGLIGLPFILVETLFGDLLDGLHSRYRGVARGLAYLLAGLIGFGLGFPIGGLLIYQKIIPVPFSGGLLVGAVAATGVGFLIYAYQAMKRRLEVSLERIKEQELAEKELEIARAIQQRLLPESEIEGEGYSIAARNIAARYVAGDFYDVFHLPDGSVCVAVADVAGKGMGASLIMSTAKAMLPLIASDRTVSETLTELNGRLKNDLGRREFVALALARFHPESGELEIGNAGVPNPFLVENGTVREVDVEGPRVPLGMMRDVGYTSFRTSLERGDRILLFTDGLPEMPCGGEEQLGYDALEQLVRQTSGETAGGWLDALMSSVERSGTGLDDDCTALVLERK